MSAVALSGNVFPKHMVEGAFASFLNQVKSAVDCCFFDKEYGLSGKISRLDNAKATYSICKQEGRDMIDMLEVYTDASLSEKHMLCRRLVRELLERFEDGSEIMLAGAMHNRWVVKFAQDITGFMVALHTVLHKDTESVLRRKLTAEFCRECLGSVREWPGRSSAAGAILDISAEST
jgi:hypothetical protein